LRSEGLKYNGSEILLLFYRMEAYRPRCKVDGAKAELDAIWEVGGHVIRSKNSEKLRMVQLHPITKQQKLKNSTGVRWDFRRRA
jgi:hypothetical protein